MRDLGDRIAWGLSAAALLFLAGVVYAGLTLPERPEPVEYTLTIAGRAAGERVALAGETNLPDGARLFVTLDRLYRLQGDGTWQAARLGAAEVAVAAGRWEAELPVAERAWVDALAGRVAAGEVDPVTAVHEALRATVAFSPLVPQVASVWEAMGPGFAALARSDAASESGGQWAIVRQEMIALPMRPDLAARLVR